MKFTEDMKFDDTNIYVLLKIKKELREHNTKKNKKSSSFPLLDGAIEANNVDI